MSERPKLLLVGPLPIDGDVIGGTKVSFAALVDALEDSESFEVVTKNTSRARAGQGGLRRAFGDLRQLGALVARLCAPQGRPAAVLWNTSAGGALLAAPLVASICRLRRVPLAVRVFGGDLDLALERAPWPLRTLARRALESTNLLLLQTRALCAAQGGDNVRWWPTTRDLARSAPAERTEARRFLFLGQLRREKGVVEALEAARALPEGATLTVHGPRMPSFDIEPLLGHPSFRYGGPLAPDQVQAALEAHDVLVFPSYHDGEGLPGAVVEALQLGLPVIASDWRALGELVAHERCGLVVPPRDVQALAAAMQRLAKDPELFRALRTGATAMGQRFRTATWTPQLTAWLLALCAGQTPAPGTTSCTEGVTALEEAA